MKQKLALSKFHKEAGDDWRNSRFIYAINSIQAQAYQVRQMIKELLDEVITSFSVFNLNRRFCKDSSISYPKRSISLFSLVNPGASFLPSKLKTYVLLLGCSSLPSKTNDQRAT
jgi:hypothetical protein